jgi:aryl-alcohol dehydrogenase-like predicted oxidoreductase
MQYRTLGNTGLTVSEVGFGAWAIGGPAELEGIQLGWGEADDATSVRAVHAALDAGVTFFDTADIYGLGHSEELLGQALGRRRKEVVLATKVGNRAGPDGEWEKDFSKEWILEAIDQSLARLKTDYVDLYQCHSALELDDYTDETFEALEALKDAGKIRHYGVSVKQTAHSVPLLQHRPEVEAVQVVYSILARAAEDELLPLARDSNVGIIARVPLASGFLTGKFRPDVTFPENDHRHRSYPPEKARRIVEHVEKLRFLERDGRKSLAQAAIQFCLSDPAVSTVIPGARTPEQARDNAAASDGELLTADELERIRAATPADLADTTIKKDTT